jgi:predicted nucleic acid-binding protein
MSVLVDTPVWSMMLRRRAADSPEARVLHRLVSQGEAVIIGAIRQEVLSGIKHADQFQRVRDRLRAFPDVPLGAHHYERAAEMYNVCRAKGVQGSNTDFLLCAVCELEGLRVFTTDQDFEHYARHLPVQLL